MVFVNEKPHVRQLVNSIGLFRLNGALFLKVLRIHERWRPALHSAAAGYDPIHIRQGDAFEILGRAVRCIREIQ